MIRSPLGLRIQPDPARSPRDQIREAARAGAKGVILDAAGDLAPDRLSDTGRRDLRNLLRTTELSLLALNLPSRRPFDTLDDLDVRLARADRAFAMGYELGAPLLLVRPGPLPPEAEAEAIRRESLVHALTELGKRADHRGVRAALESGTEPASELTKLLDAIASPGLAASLEPASMARGGNDPVVGVRDLVNWLAHAYAPDESAATGGFHPRGGRFAAGAIDWEEYLGALEEIAYRGFLTVWPDPNGDAVASFVATKARLDRY